MSTFLNNAKIKCASFTRTYGPMSTIQRARKYTTPELTVQDGNFGSLRCGEGLVGRGVGGCFPSVLVGPNTLQNGKMATFCTSAICRKPAAAPPHRDFLTPRGVQWPYRTTVCDLPRQKIWQTEGNNRYQGFLPIRKYGKQKETTDIKGFCPLENMANRRKQQISRVFAH